MRRYILPLAALLAAAPLAAQGDPQCNNLNPAVQNACNAAVDALKAFHPLAGVIVSGGDPILGRAGTLGGFGHFTLSARVNAVRVAIPDPSQATRDTVHSSVNTLAPAPVVEAGLGVYNGLGHDGGLLAVDLLGSATLLPTTQVSGLSVDPGAAHVGSLALGLGYGARVGILPGSFPIPSLSVSVMRRTLPRVQFGSLSPTGDQFEFDTDLQAWNYRVTAGLRLLFFDVAAGVGLDHYTSTAHIRYYNAPPATTVDTVTENLANTRQLLFVDAGMNLALFKLVAEAGLQTGKDQQFSGHTYDFDPKAGHAFFGAGVRFSF
ncbi:MAG TPA: hypothetical protein VFK78_12415 [Gemmatimonadales bacterium]|nr:hypothetical protein [Gemmatimonadales bacterium]